MSGRILRAQEHAQRIHACVCAQQCHRRRAAPRVPRGCAQPSYQTVATHSTALSRHAHRCRFSEEEAEAKRLKEEEKIALNYLTVQVSYLGRSLCIHLRTVQLLREETLFKHVNHELFVPSELEAFKALKTTSVQDFVRM